MSIHQPWYDRAVGWFLAGVAVFDRVACPMRLDGGQMSEKTLSDELREENDRLQRRFIHHTRPRRPMTMDEALELAERMANVGSKTHQAGE